MSLLPTSRDVDIAANLLVNKYGLTIRKLGKLMKREVRDQVRKIYQTVAQNEMALIDIVKVYVNNKGAMLFSGSDRVIRDFRKDLLRCLDEDKVLELYNRYIHNGTYKDPGHMRTALAERNWYNGQKWPRDFVQNLGFPEVFAGVKSPGKPSAVIEIEPHYRLPDLKEYQLDLKNRMKQVLLQEGNKTRCIVTLPTGGGKTRIAVEAFVEWMQPEFGKRKYLVWIAQSEELCEQAIACIQDVWRNTTFVEPLKVYRYFGGNNIDADEMNGGVVVTSIHQLYNRIKSEDEVIDLILGNTGAMIIDEAHGAITHMYKVLFNRAKRLCGDDIFPVCGLTATPGRNNEKTRLLVDEFHAYLIKPDLPQQYQNKPLQYFRKNGYLAYARHVIVENDKVYEMDEEEIASFLKEDQVNYENSRSIILRLLAADEDRNALIIKTLLEIPEGNQVLVYACTVEHAEMLSAILNSLGRSSVSISAETPNAIRRLYIEDFKKCRIQFIFNYGVLTTGFDAPKTNYVVICRPTSSVILYEQIIGRGMRGPKFGGTEKCTVIDFSDNVIKHGEPLAYQRFSHYWPDFWDEEAEQFAGQQEVAAAKEI